MQLASEAAGHACPRDADMQAAELGSAARLAGSARARRGDLVFWDGHVGIMTSAQDLAARQCAYHMAVVDEPFAEAQGAHRRIDGGEVIGVRRLPRISAPAAERVASEARRTATAE